MFADTRPATRTNCLKRPCATSSQTALVLVVLIQEQGIDKNTLRLCGFELLLYTLPLLSTPASLQQSHLIGCCMSEWMLTAYKAI